MNLSNLTDPERERLGRAPRWVQAMAARLDASIDHHRSEAAAFGSAEPTAILVDPYPEPTLYLPDAASVRFTIPADPEAPGAWEEYVEVSLAHQRFPGAGPSVEVRAGRPIVTRAAASNVLRVEPERR